LQSLIPWARRAAHMTLTPCAKHHILCPIAVPSTTTGAK
jgi:hypothetical protein